MYKIYNWCSKLLIKKGRCNRKEERNEIDLQQIVSYQSKQMNEIEKKKRRKMKKGSRQVSCERIWFTFPRGKVKLRFRDRRQEELSPFSGQLARSSECFESDRRQQNFQALAILFSVTAIDVLFITRLTQSLRPRGFFPFLSDGSLVAVFPIFDTFLISTSIKQQSDNVLIGDYSGDLTTGSINQ